MQLTVSSQCFNNNLTVSSTGATVQLNVSSNVQSVGINLQAGGASGLSAYQIAVANGFEGTDAEWLDSLKAEAGEVDWTGVQNKPSTFPPEAHAHAISDVTNLQTALDGKAAASHSHAISDVTNLQTALDGKQASGSYASAVHTHAIADVTNLQTALDGKQASGSYAASTHTHAIADVTNLQTALDGKAASSHTHSIANVTNLQTTLDNKADLVGGVLQTSQLPALAVVEFLGDVANQSAMLALIGQRGDWCIRTDEDLAYVLIADNPSSLASWRFIEFPASPVSSVNGQTGTIVLGKSDVGLGNVDNTTDLNKPISTATQTALDGKASTSHTHVIADVTNLQTTLDGKAATSHTHVIADVTNLQTTLDGKAATSHTHLIADVTGLQTAIDGKQATLVSGTNIKTVNGESLLGSDNLVISGGLTDAPSDNDSYARRNGEWIVIPRFLTYVTVANKTKNNDTTWVNDDELISDTLVANALYRVELLLMTQADAATDFAFRIARTGLSDADLRVAGDLDNSASTTFTWLNQQNIAGAGATALRMGNYIGYLKTGANTGNIAFQWRQQTSGVGNTTLGANSMLMLRRIN